MHPTAAKARRRVMLLAFGGLGGAMGVRFEVRVNGRVVCVAALERPGLRFAESINSGNFPSGARG